MESNNKKPEAIILLSGGLDSTTTLAIAEELGFSCNCLSFNYGQKQTFELQRAKLIAQRCGAKRHLVLNLDLAKIGGSALTDDFEVPKDREDIGQSDDIPITYVPARNTILLAHALAWGEVIGAADIFIGVNAIDYSGYPDCRPEFLEAFTNMANFGTKSGTTQKPFSIHAPLITMTKAEIIRKGLSLGVDYSITHSCYDPEADAACGRCDACRLRLKGFEEAGIPDPAPYAE